METAEPKPCSCRKNPQDDKCIKLKTIQAKSDTQPISKFTQTRRKPRKCKCKIADCRKCKKHRTPVGKKTIVYEKASPKISVRTEIDVKVPSKGPSSEYLEAPDVIFAMEVSPTLSSLEIAIQLAKDKCYEKDAIIAAMVDKIGVDQKEGVYERILHKAGGTSRVPDYGIMLLEQSGASRSFINVPYYISKDRAPNSETKHSPLRITSLKRVTDTVWLLKWNVYNSIDVIGYNLYVNGKLTTGVISPESDKMIFSLDADIKQVELKLIAITPLGPCLPYAVAYAS